MSDSTSSAEDAVEIDCGVFPCDGSCRCECSCHMEDMGLCAMCEFYDDELSCDHFREAVDDEE